MEIGSATGKHYPEIRQTLKPMFLTEYAEVCNMSVYAVWQTEIQLESILFRLRLAC